RTIYLGKIPEESTLHEVLDLIRTGNLENAKLIPEKHCAFITFIEADAAQVFHRKASFKTPLRLKGRELKVGWGTPSILSPNIQKAVQNEGATRNVFIGRLDSSFTEEIIHKDLLTFGAVEEVKIVREKNIAFAHFTHINNAIKAVTQLPLQSRYAGKEISYGRDRCAKFATPIQLPTLDGITTTELDHQKCMVPFSTLIAEGKRTIYLGKLAPETTCADICNSIRGGILSKIRYLSKKYSAFVTFVDPKAAQMFYDTVSKGGFKIKNQKPKLGWGPKALNLPLEVIQAFRQGACRNVYLGGIEGIADEEKLRADFSEYGEIELINVVPSKNCGFVSFTDVLAAVKAVKNIPLKSEYATVKVGYGKDRCGQPPKEA
ncbi:hypothetical protein BCR41DRAFT_295486, partial [Lobosporangium transversale]